MLFRSGVAAATVKTFASRFHKANGDTKGRVVVHHAVEQQVLRLYPGRFTEQEIHSTSNARGIPKGINSDLHLRIIRSEWDAFYAARPNATRREIEAMRDLIDCKYGPLFIPPMQAPQ